MPIPDDPKNEERIRPYDANPFYWHYRGEPVLLLGGSVEDNLFQIDDLEPHLDQLAAVGGNYVRCTLSSRDSGDVWPFERHHKSGLYDLNQPGTAYWERLGRFLELCDERAIIAQIELWDRFDFAREPWQENPYNPKNNHNYTAQASGLLETITTHPGKQENAFFRTVPALDNNEIVLSYQQRQVDKLLDLALPYGNVLYCIDNETNEAPAWGAYWSDYLRAKAVQAGVSLQITEMWDAWDLSDPQHDATFDHPERYSFIDISQNNHQGGLAHWENAQRVRERVIRSAQPRPLNSVKIYGANSGRYGTTRDAQERFWRNIFGGLASSRFHRPLAGLGLSEIAQAHLKAMRMLLEHLDIFRCEPSLELLGNRSWNEAYCTAQPGVAYAVFFTDGGSVTLDVSALGSTETRLRWLDIRKCRWTGNATAEVKENTLELTPPAAEGYWVALVTPAES